MSQVAHREVAECGGIEEGRHIEEHLRVVLVARLDEALLDRLFPLLRFAPAVFSVALLPLDHEAHQLFEARLPFESGRLLELA